MEKETIKSYLENISLWIYAGKFVRAYRELDFVIEEIKNDLKARQDVLKSNGGKAK